MFWDTIYIIYTWGSEVNGADGGDGNSYTIFTPGGGGGNGGGG